MCNLSTCKIKRVKTRKNARCQFAIHLCNLHTLAMLSILSSCWHVREKSYTCARYSFNRGCSTKTTRSRMVSYCASILSNLPSRLHHHSIVSGLGGCSYWFSPLAYSIKYFPMPLLSMYTRTPSNRCCIRSIAVHRSAFAPLFTLSASRI